MIEIIQEYWKSLLWTDGYRFTGVAITLWLLISSVVMGGILAVFLAIGRVSSNKFIQFPIWLFTYIFRGTPLFVQILLVHFALMPALLHPETGLLLSGEVAHTFRQEHGAFFSGCLALSLNAGAYISEIFRAGIQSIHLGQTQAGYSLGLTHAQSMRYVILPQAFRRMVPALVNEGITLIKDSSLVSAIGLAELALAARTVAGAYSRYWEPYLAISAIYLVLTLVLSTLAKRLETPAYQRGR